MQLPNRGLKPEDRVHFERRVGNDFRRLRDLLIEKTGVELPLEPSVETLWNVAREHDIDLDLFLQGKTDFDVLTKRINGDVGALPMRYIARHKQGSRGRTVLTILDSIQHHLGQRFCDNVMRRLQLSPMRRFTSEEYVNLNLIVDLLTEVRRFGLAEDDFRVMGFRSAVVNQDSALGEAMRPFDRGHQIYRAMHEECMHFFDNHFVYRIQRLSADHADIKITLNEETAEAFGSRNVGSREQCLLRQGIYASMTLPTLGKPAVVTESRCMHVQGDHCLYHIRWT